MRPPEGREGGATCHQAHGEEPLPPFEGEREEPRGESGRGVESGACVGLWGGRWARRSFACA